MLNDPSVKQKDENKSSTYNVSHGDREVYIRKKKKETNFTQIDNPLIDNFGMDEGKEFTLLIKLLRLPDNWVIHPYHLAEHFKCSYKVFYTNMTKLIKKGYVERSVIRKNIIKNGRNRNVIKGYEYYVSEEILLDSHIVQVQESHTTKIYNSSSTYGTFESSTNTTSPPSGIKSETKNSPLGGGINPLPIGEEVGGVLTTPPVSEKPPSGDGFLDKSFSPKKTNPTPKQRKRVFKHAKELLEVKDPMKHLTPAEVRTVYSIAKKEIVQMHEQKTNVKYKRGTVVNYLARGMLGGFQIVSIVERYREALAIRHAEKPPYNKPWDPSSTVTMAFDNLIGDDKITIAERFKKNIG